MHTHYRPQMAHPHLRVVPNPAPYLSIAATPDTTPQSSRSERIDYLIGTALALWMAWQVWHSALPALLIFVLVWCLLVLGALSLCMALGG